MITTNHFGKSLAIIFGGVATVLALSAMFGPKPQNITGAENGNQKQVVEEVKNKKASATVKL